MNTPDPIQKITAAQARELLPELEESGLSVAEFARQRNVDHVPLYNARRAALAHVDPNAAHRALARLEAQWPGELLLVTQNVDDLHERGGARRLLHMHGELQRALCTGCGAAPAWTGDLSDHPPCPRCGAARLRPDIVWFGEMPYHMDAIEAAIATCDLFVSIGTSGAVYPAAGFVSLAHSAGARTLEINLDRSAGTPLFDAARHGPAGTLVPVWVDEILGVIPPPA